MYSVEKKPTKNRKPKTNKAPRPPLQTKQTKTIVSAIDSELSKKQKRRLGGSNLQNPKRYFQHLCLTHLNVSGSHSFLDEKQKKKTEKNKDQMI